MGRCYDHKDIALSSCLYEARGQAVGWNAGPGGIKAKGLSLVGPWGQPRANGRPEECNGDWANRDQSADGLQGTAAGLSVYNAPYVLWIANIHQKG